ncbi:MAG: hypothetical protein V1892_03035, partial [bacterium]
VLNLIKYYISNDGGASWVEPVLGVDYVFGAAGNDLRWRANLSTTSGTVTPEIDTINITYY